MTQSGFGVYFDAAKTTSGQRFFGALSRELRGEAVPVGPSAKAVLFNISAPVTEILRAKLRGQRVALRVDGLYVDRLSVPFLQSFRWPMRQLLALGLRHRRLRDPLSHLANFLNENYRAFVRIVLADLVIYQSEYCREVHQRYFPKKPWEVIVNGSVYQGATDGVGGQEPRNEVRLVTIYDGDSPRKRVHDLVDFVRWARETMAVPLYLTILGYTGRIPAGAPARTRSLIESTDYIRTLPRFESLDGEVQRTLLASDMYVTFTHRDPCPNAVVEGMSHGLPVVGVASGGLPDIVGDAGVLLAEAGDRGGFFCPWRYESEFPSIDYGQALRAIMDVKASLPHFKARVEERFRTTLGIDVVASRYGAVLRGLCGGGARKTG